MSELGRAPSIDVGQFSVDSGRGANADQEALRRAAEEFESVFLAQMLKGATEGLSGDQGLGADSAYGDMLRTEYAKMIANAGGVGVADAIVREMLAEQEV